jgi:hypothetical protein
MNSTERDLNTSLAREANRFFEDGGAPLDLGQVLDRAGEIRRGRRMRATMLMAACVLAIAVPTALLSTRGHHEAAVTPAGHGKVAGSSLTLVGLDQGPSPHGGYAEAGQLHLAGGPIRVTTGSDAIVAIAPINGAYLLATRGEGGDLTARVVDDRGGAIARTWPMEGGFAVSDGGNVGAFVEPDGTVVAVQDAGSLFFEVAKIPMGSGFGAIAVQGENCSGRSEQAGCKVYATTSDQKPQTYVAAPHDIVALAIDTSLRKTVDVAADGRLAGMVSSTDTGSCSQVVTGDLTLLWKTCEHRFLSFSPTGDHLLASSAYADGMGDSQVAVLDSATGKTLLDLKTADQAVTTQVVWEDDSHLLAVVIDQGRWAVVRIGLDGSRELALPPVADSGDLASAYVLPSR